MLNLKKENKKSLSNNSESQCLGLTFKLGNYLTIGRPYCWAPLIFPCKLNVKNSTIRFSQTVPSFNTRFSVAETMIPETGTFDGPEELPEDIAEEIRKVFIDEKLPSEKLKAYMHKRNQFESRWSLAKPDIPVGWVSHVMVVAAKTADLYWKRYEYTLDENWLRDRAYPMLRGAAEFYRNYPNLKKDTDGKYHIYHKRICFVESFMLENRH